MTWLKAAIAACIVFATAFVALVVWRASKPHGPEYSPHAAVVIDISASTVSPCESAGGLVGRALTIPNLDKWSTVAVFATGDALSRAEPVEVANLSDLKTVRAMEAPAAGVARGRARISAVVEACSRLPRTSTSPLVLAARRGIEYLRAQGCRKGSGCQLLFQTDGEENVEPGVRRALAGSAAVPALPAPIDNDGITVVVCGFMATTGQGDLGGNRRRGHSTGSAERTSAVWHGLFSAPDLVTLQPSCPKAAAFTVAESGKASR